MRRLVATALLALLMTGCGRTHDTEVSKETPGPQPTSSDRGLQQALLAADRLPPGTFPGAGFASSKESLAAQRRGCDGVAEQLKTVKQGHQALTQKAAQDYLVPLTAILQQTLTNCRWNIEYNVRAGRDEPLRARHRELDALQTEREGELAWLRNPACARTSWGSKGCALLADVFDHTNRARIDYQLGKVPVSAVGKADQEWFARLQEGVRALFPAAAEDAVLQRDWRSSNRLFTLVAENAMADLEDERAAFAALP